MSTIKANTLLAANGSSTTPPSIPALDTRFATAWVLFDGVAVSGTSAAPIGRSYNVSSITDIATGRYYVNFTNAMNTDKYVTVAAGLSTANGTNRNASAAPFDTSKCYVNTTVTNGGANNDIAFISLLVFGGQA